MHSFRHAVEPGSLHQVKFAVYQLHVCTTERGVRLAPLRVLVLQASAFTWFVVQTRSGDLTPYSIRHVVKPMTVLPGEHMQQQLLNLAETVKDDYGRMDLSSMWRPYGRCVHADNITSMPAGAKQTNCNE